MVDRFRLRRLLDLNCHLKIEPSGCENIFFGAILHRHTLLIETLKVE